MFLLNECTCGALRGSCFSLCFVKLILYNKLASRAHFSFFCHQPLNLALATASLNPRVCSCIWCLSLFGKRQSFQLHSEWFLLVAASRVESNGDPPPLSQPVLNPGDARLNGPTYLTDISPEIEDRVDVEQFLAEWLAEPQRQVKPLHIA